MEHAFTCSLEKNMQERNWRNAGDTRSPSGRPPRLRAGTYWRSLNSPKPQDIKRHENRATRPRGQARTYCRRLNSHQPQEKKGMQKSGEPPRTAETTRGQGTNTQKAPTPTCTTKTQPPFTRPTWRTSGQVKQPTPTFFKL